jgi:hypothetical protein
VSYVAPSFSGPHRALVLAASTHGWYQGSTEDRERALARFRQVLKEWEELGAQLVGSVDDDYFVTGQPSTLGWSIFIVYDVPSVETIVEMIQRVRETVDGARLDTYLRFEARLGRPLFLLDN